MQVPSDQSSVTAPLPDNEYSATDSSVGESIPVVEEVAEITKRKVDTGGVRVVKTVETRSELVDEALWRDAISIERRSADRAVNGTEAPRPYWQGDTLVVPIVEEVLVVSRQLRVREELLIQRQRHEYRAPQQVSLRREKVVVERILSNHSISQQDTYMSTALVGVFENREQATNAYNALLGAGFSASEISLRAGGADEVSATGTVRDDSSGSTFGDWFRSLFGLDDDYDEVRVYDEALRRGHYLLTVASVSEDRIDRATSIMENCGSIDVDERATQWTDEGWTSGTRAGAQTASGSVVTGETNLASGETKTLPVVEEELRVGKRVVGSGGVRVYTRVLDKPVQETVNLREERATVERRPVDRPASEADLQALKEGTLEVRESAEEAVVSKHARVVEEVEIGKEVRERTETVRDTVRHTEVEVDRTAGKTGEGRSTLAGTDRGTDVKTSGTGAANPRTTGSASPAGGAGASATPGGAGTTKRPSDSGTV